MTLIGIAALVLSGWSLVLIWGTWRLNQIAKALELERETLRRWNKFKTLNDKQRERIR